MRAYLALWAVLFAGLRLAGGQHPDSNPRNLVAFQAPPTHSFQDLIDLAAEDPPEPALKERLARLLSEPFISNEATLSGALPKRPHAGGIPVLRVAEWNVNRGVNGGDIKAALSGNTRLLRNAANLSAKKRHQEAVRHFGKGRQLSASGESSFQRSVVPQN